MDLTGQDEDKQTVAPFQLAQFHQGWWFSARALACESILVQGELDAGNFCSQQRVQYK
jgi:hypothetical protein